MYGALLFIVGWFYYYICLRQLLFDFTVGYPLIGKFGKAGVMAATGAHRLNTISVLIWFVICVLLGFVALRFLHGYLLISFLIGVALGLVMFLNRLTARTRSNFDAFCRTYCRFVEDDDLRNAMYQADLPKMRAALRALGSDLTFDDFKN